MAEKLETGDIDIINVASTVQAICYGSTLNISWDGTSKTAYRGEIQYSIAEKQETIDIWEIELKKENLDGLKEDHPVLWDKEYNSI